MAIAGNPYPVPAVFDVDNACYVTKMPPQPTFRTLFCVLENFLLETHTIDNLPAKEGYRSHRILDFARMGRS